jgi:hypothetical protein
MHRVQLVADGTSQTIVTVYVDVNQTTIVTGTAVPRG